MSCTIVLVHGAFAESASWDGVIDPLVAQGHRVVAAPNPLRGTGRSVVSPSMLPGNMPASWKQLSPASGAKPLT